MIAIIDLEISNITSVFNAFQKIGVEAKITNDMAEIETAGALILPGVGAFEQGINFLNNSGLAEIICERVLEKKIPILGICLGMQLLANSSTENGNHIGLGLLEGRVERLKPSNSLQSIIYQRLDVLETIWPLLGFNKDALGRRSGIFMGEGIWRWRMESSIQNGNSNVIAGNYRSTKASS